MVTLTRYDKVHLNNLLKEKCMMYNYGYIDNDNIAHEHLYDKVHLNNLLKEKCMIYNYGYIDMIILLMSIYTTRYT